VFFLFSHFRTICGRRVKVELSSGKTRREMAQQRTINPRESRYSPRGGRSPRARSPRERERREYYHEARDEREYYKTRPKKHRSRLEIDDFILKITY